MVYVIDCSFSAALFLPDESSQKVQGFFLKISKQDSLIVPSLWWSEIINVLVVSQRRNRLSHADAIKIFSLFDVLNIETDEIFGINHSKEIYELSQLYQLSSYDTQYLDLAIRCDATLATLDKKLLKSAEKAGVKVIK